jgi:transcriptional regulator with GAF, ATPase, and Fis domain
VAEAVGSTLASWDLFVELGGCQYAILLAAGDEPGDLDRRRASLMEALAQLGPALGVGEARVPEDGQRPEPLLSFARQRLERSCLAVDSEQQVVFHDPRMRKLHQLGRHAAAGLINVLLLGETGVGKDVFARAIHRLSPRRNQPFQRIECAALTEALAESELFGHARGAFTGAMRDKPGLLEMADGGTVFLDEVGELPPRLQAKLLHVLETRRLTRVGALEGRAVDLRFIAATNRDLEAESLAGGFRRDLYYRLCGFTLTIPSLRERRGDIAPLARALVRQCCQRLGRDQVPALTPAALARLMAHDWPGNVRELRNAVERAVLICRSGPDRDEHLLLEPGRPALAVAAPPRAAEAPPRAAEAPPRAEPPRAEPPGVEGPGAPRPATTSAGSRRRWPPVAATRAARPSCWALPEAPWCCGSRPTASPGRGRGDCTTQAGRDALFVTHDLLPRDPPLGITTPESDTPDADRPETARSLW